MAAEDRNREEKIRSLELAVVEQRRDYDVLEKLYERAKVKNITFLAAGLTLLAFLYSTVPDGRASFAHKLFLPKEP